MTEHVITLHQGYGNTGALYDDLDDIVDAAANRLADLDFDTIVGTGMSGSIVIPLMARALNKNFLLIRKDGAGAHTSSHVGRLGTRWLFVDDFISTGATFRRVEQAIDGIVDIANRWGYAGEGGHVATFVGSYLYAPYDGPTFVPGEAVDSIDHPTEPEPHPEPCPCPACRSLQLSPEAVMKAAFKLDDIGTS